MSRETREAIFGFLMILPAFIGLTVFILGPTVVASFLAFTDYAISFPPEPLNFVGFKNFIQMFKDPWFIQATLNTFYFVGVDVPIQCAIALMLALLVNHKLPGHKFFRSVYFVPTLTPLVLAGVIFSLLLGRNAMVNAALGSVGLGPFRFLSSRLLAMPSIIITTFWHGTGFQFIIFLAGLQNIPKRLYEAARIDGSNAWQQFRYVTLPQLRNTIVVALVITTIYAFRLFTLPYVMTSGGPGGATRSLIMYIHARGIENLSFGYSSAMALFYFIIVLILSLSQRYFLDSTR